MNIPLRMRGLHRGYPIPYIVLRTTDGRAHFTVNDHSKVENAARKQLCGICGRRLFKDERWFVGGPMSAFHPRGAYIDGPVHHECGTFALETCPYLAAPRYNRRIDDATVDQDTLGDNVVLHDPTMEPERPELFVFACARSYKFELSPQLTNIFRPKRPWIMYEFWEKGVRLTAEQAQPLVQANFERHGL